MELAAPVIQVPPLITTSSSAADTNSIPSNGHVTTPINLFELDFPTPESDGVPNPFEFPPPSPTSRQSNPFMDELISSTSPRRSINPFDFSYHYSSAPSSPTRAAAIYAEFKSVDDSFFARASFSTSSNVPFHWEEKPGTPKSLNLANSEKSITSSPEFEFNAPLEENAPRTDLTTADELFEEGKIRPLKPPPRLQLLAIDESRSSMSANPSPQSAKSWALRSPRNRTKRDFDPFAAAMAVATADRGREENVNSSHTRKVSRSLSPSRLGRGNSLEEKIASFKSSMPPELNETSSTGTGTSKSSSKKSRKKWRLSDLLLFRNASEGRLAGNRSKDPIFKYSPSRIFNGSQVLRSPDSEKKAGGGNETKKHGPLSLKAMKGCNLFTKKTATANEKQHVVTLEDQKKKSQVPFRQGVFSCMRINPSMNRLGRGMNTHHLSKGK
jgi:Protein of unknown function (DUF1645)